MSYPLSREKLNSRRLDSPAFSIRKVVISKLTIDLQQSEMPCLLAGDVSDDV